MSLLGIALRYLRHRGTQTALAAAAVASAAALALAVPWIAEGARTAVGRHASRWSLVIAAEGSDVQVALAALFFLEPPSGNVPRAVLEEAAAAPGVAAAIPIGLGDSVRGRRIVGTVPAYLEDLPLSAGRRWEGPFEAVVGAGLARDFPPGAAFVSAHGVVGGDAHPEHPYRVVGVLAPTGGPDDVAVFTSIESVWEVHGARGARADSEVTAVLLRYANPMRAFADERAWSARPGLRAIVPARTATRIYALVGRGAEVLEQVASLVVVVAALTVLLAVSASAAARRREFALLRVLGARPATLFSLAVLEAALLGAGGAAAGALGAWLLFRLAAGRAAAATGLGLVLPAAGRLLASAGKVVVGLGLLGAAAGLPPAVAAYRTDVARHVRGEI